ncbi:MAG TPA: hypothetical protein VM328_01970, partial [Fimbriimonadaceae bacterium]|nr:hypothetical protein [Fimbriimonadaceae bacterium]
MHSNPLAHPVHALMRPCESVRTEDSLELTATRLRSSGLQALPVTNGPYLVGLVTETGLASALASGAEPAEPVTRALGAAVTIGPR